MGVHDGHRSRVYDRFKNEGLDHFSPHNVLELLLFFAVPRRDTNQMAHDLINGFGSLSAVLEAPIDELKKYDGIGDHAATLLHMIPEIARFYMSEQHENDCMINSTEAAGAYVLPSFVGRSTECVFVTLLDGKGKVLHHELLFRGSINSAAVNLRDVVALALRHNAVGVIVSHNHPGGTPMPSSEDMVTTHRIREALELVGVHLIDHLIVAGGHYLSLAESGEIIRPF